MAWASAAASTSATHMHAEATRVLPQQLSMAYHVPRHAQSRVACAGVHAFQRSRAAMGHGGRQGQVSPSRGVRRLLVVWLFLFWGHACPNTRALVRRHTQPMHADNPGRDLWRGSSRSSTHTLTEQSAGMSTNTLPSHISPSFSPRPHPMPQDRQFGRSKLSRVRPALAEGGCTSALFCSCRGLPSKKSSFS